MSPYPFMSMRMDVPAEHDGLKQIGVSHLNRDGQGTTIGIVSVNREYAMAIQSAR